MPRNGKQIFAVIAVLSCVGILNCSRRSETKTSKNPALSHVPLPVAGPYVSFVFVGACNFRFVGKGNSTLEVLMPEQDQPNSVVIGQHSVGEHLARVQFNKTGVNMGSATPESCTQDANCVLVPLGTSNVTFTFPGSLGSGVTKANPDTFDQYVVKMKEASPGSAMKPTPGVASILLNQGELSATGSAPRLGYFVDPKTAKEYQRDVVLVVPLAATESKFTMHVGTQDFVFDYASRPQRFIRFLNVHHDEFCKSEEADNGSATDEDFALNYVLAENRPPEPYPVLHRAGSPGSPMHMTFCQLEAKLLAAMNVPAGVERNATTGRSATDTFLMMMGSDCIGGNWGPP